MSHEGFRILPLHAAKLRAYLGRMLPRRSRALVVVVALALTMMTASPASAESWLLWSNLFPFSTRPLGGWRTDKDSTFATKEACFAEMSWMAHSFVTSNMRTAREVRKVDPDNFVRTWDVTRVGNRTTLVGTVPTGAKAEFRQLISYWECAPAGATPRDPGK